MRSETRTQRDLASLPARCKHGSACSFGLRVASVWNALVVPVSGTASPCRETASETSRLRLTHSSAASHDDLPHGLMECVRSRDGTRCRDRFELRPFLPVTAGASCRTHGVGPGCGTLICRLHFELWDALAAGHHCMLLARCTVISAIGAV